jgi:hypothetical protein
MSATSATNSPMGAAPLVAGGQQKQAESSEDYRDVVLILNDRWRVIEGRDRIQWILQYRNRAKTVARDVWRGRSYCHTREALIRICEAQVELDKEHRTVLAELPEIFSGGEGGQGRSSKRASTFCSWQSSDVADTAQLCRD